VIDLEYFPRRSDRKVSIRVNLDAKFLGNEIQTAVSYSVLPEIYTEAYFYESF